MFYASLFILFNYHSLKVLYSLGLKWMDITIWMGITICMDALSCSNRKQELATSILAAETASWGDHMWLRPHVSPASETSVGFEECKGLLHRGRTGKRPTPWCKASKQPPRAACGTAGSGHRSTGDLLVFLTLLGTSFPTPACCQRSKNMENGTKGQVWFLPCPAVPRWVQAGWLWGGRMLPCHSTARYCVSVS